MPRRSILSASERDSLLALPDNRDDLIRRYTLSEHDLSIVRQRRGAANRLGFAVQLCYLCYPGIVLGVDQLPLPALLHLVAGQLKIPVERWTEYGERAQTRREHLVELQTVYGFEPFAKRHHRLAEGLLGTALQTDKGIVLASGPIGMLGERAILQPCLNVIEAICAKALTRANRSIYKQRTEALTETHRERLDGLLQRQAKSSMTQLAWLRQAPLKPNSKHMLQHIKRLQTWRALDLPSGIDRQVHQNRLLKIAREGGQMTSADLMKFERERRYATLVAIAIEGTATVTDEVIDLHDRIVGKLFDTAKHKHQEQFQADGRAINNDGQFRISSYCECDSAWKIPTNSGSGELAGRLCCWPEKQSVQNQLEIETTRRMLALLWRDFLYGSLIVRACSCGCSAASCRIAGTVRLCWLATIRSAQG